MPAKNLKRMGNYLLRKRVGRGRVGKVYEGIHRTTNQRVAIKVLSNNVADDHCCVACFEKNVKAAKDLRHPNIVRTRDIGEFEGRYFCTMEFVEGQNLAEYQRANGALKPVDALKLFVQAADGLKHAWRKNLVHGHLSPNNLLITTAGQLKICDFGTAGAHSDINEDETGEDFDPCELDPKVDVLALSVLLYGSLVGKPLALPEGKSHKFNRSELTALTPPLQSLLLRLTDPQFPPVDLLGAIEETLHEQEDWDRRHAIPETVKSGSRGIKRVSLAVGAGVIVMALALVHVLSKQNTPTATEAVATTQLQPYEEELQKLQAALPSLIEQRSYVDAFDHVASANLKFNDHPTCKVQLLKAAVEIISAADNDFREREAQFNAQSSSSSADSVRKFASAHPLEFIRTKSHLLLLTLYQRSQSGGESTVQLTTDELPVALAQLLKKRNYETARVLCMIVMAQSESPEPDSELMTWVDWLTDACEFWRTVADGAKHAVGRHATFRHSEDGKTVESVGAISAVEGESLSIKGDDRAVKIPIRSLAIDNALRLTTTLLDTTDPNTQRRIGRVFILDLKKEEGLTWLRQATDADGQRQIVDQMENTKSLIRRILEAAEYDELLASYPESIETIAARELDRRNVTSEPAD